MKISENFHRSEFACQCGCGFDTVDVALVDVLQHIRTASSASLVILSGCRCHAHNEKVGGAAKNSQHKKGRAADVASAALPVEELAQMAKDLGVSVGIYPTWVHIDTRSGPPRFWDAR